MKKNLKIGIGVVAAMVIGISAYGMAGGEFQGRFEYKKTKYIAGSTRLCLKPKEYEKKYPMPRSMEESDTEGGGSITIESKETREGGSTEESKDTPVIKTPETTGRGGNTIVKEEEIEKEDIPKINYVECSCKRKGFEYFTKDEEGKDVKNICVVNDWLKCVDPDFICPEGTKMDWLALNDLCRAKKQKNCFSSLKPDFKSKEDAMCKSLIGAYKEPICVTPDECEMYALLMAGGTYSSYLEKNGITGSPGAVCDFMHPEIWNKK